MEKDASKVKLKKSSTKTQLWFWNKIEKWILSDVQFFNLSNQELKRVFQNWIKKSWVYLLWWQPWIWKSTIIIQIIDDLLNNNSLSIWYFSWEESSDQIYSRIKRIWNNNFNSKNHKFDIYNANVLEDILQTISDINYDFFVIDSIQTIYSPNIDWVAWWPSQVKFCAEKISEFSKKNNKTCFIIWHVTKWWEIAWPKYLEHIVDMVSYLEWDRFWQYRFLRSIKNRFWSTNDVSIFEMWLFWLTPVYDLKDRIINNANTSIPWSVFTVWIDNWRPVIVNLEVLINKTNYKYPQRVTLWIDSNRLNLIIAILERYLKMNLWYFDIYVNLPWEFKFYDSWLDLALAAAIISQYNNKLINKNKVFIWEIWLWWQILPTKLHDKRKSELPEWFELVSNNVLKNIIELKNYI